MEDIMNNFWEILGISPTENKKEIRAAYAAKTKQYHPEENPEEFAMLNNAYKAALNYISNKNKGIETIEIKDDIDINQNVTNIVIEDIDTIKHDTDIVNNIDADSSTSLLSRLQDFEKQEIKENLEKIKKSKEKGALKKFIYIFEQAKETGKFPRADVWKEFFLSDEFLNEQYTYVFANGIINYLTDWNMDGNYNIFQLPDSFLVELAIAFALMPEQDYMDTDGGHVIYRANDIGFPARETAANLWNSQQRTYPPVRILYKNENLVRLHSFSDYIRLRKLNSQNELTEDNKKVWHDLLTGGCVNHIYELNGKGQHNIYVHTRSITLIRLLSFWVQNENIPNCILEHMYKEYDLRRIEHSSREKLYAPLKQAILKHYPDIEDKLFGEESLKQLVSSWYREFTKIVAEKETDFNKGIYEDSETIKLHVRQLFENSAWQKVRTSKELSEKLHLQLIGREALPKALADCLIEFYSDKALTEGDDTFCGILDNVLLALSFSRRVMEINGVLPIIGETANIENISDDNMEFWFYYLMTGFGFRNITLDGTRYKKYSYGNNCFLPYYMKCMYYPSVLWRKIFTGFDDATGNIQQPVFTEFTLPDGKKLKVEFHLNYCLYFLDDNPVYNARYTFEQCLEFSKHIEKTEHKFFLLAITSIGKEDTEQAVDIIEKWLQKLKLYSYTIHIIARMLASDNARLFQEIPANISKTDITKDEINAIYYNENERFCFRMVASNNSIILSYKGDFGWLVYDKIIDKNITNYTDNQRNLLAKSTLESLMPKTPDAINTISLDGMDNKQKAEKILEALICYGKIKNSKNNKVPFISCYPWNKEKISEPVKEFFDSIGNFITESYCVLSYGKQKKRKEVFYFAVKPFDAINGHGINYTDIDQINDLNKKIKKEHLIAGSFGLSNACSLDVEFRLKPFAIGFDGTYYVYDIFHMHKSNSLTEIISKTYDLSNVTQVEVYNGFLSVSNLDGKFEYCYDENDFKKSVYNLEAASIDKFTRFTKAEMMLEFADMLDDIFSQVIHGLCVLCFVLQKEDNNMYSLCIYSQNKENGNDYFYSNCKNFNDSNNNVYNDDDNYSNSCNDDYNNDDNYSSNYGNDYNNDDNYNFDYCVSYSTKGYMDKHDINVLNGNQKIAWKIWGGERQYINLSKEILEILFWYMDYGQYGKKLKNSLRIDVICNNITESIYNTAGIFDALRERTKNTAYLMEVNENKTVDIFDSKFGGMPYWIHDKEYPTDSEGKKLLLIAQINLDKSPLEEFGMCSGMLQFFGDSEEIFKEDFGFREDMDKYRVIYHETIDYNISRDELKALGVPDSTGNEYKKCIMTSKELPMEITQKTVYISVGDYRFDMEFKNAIKDKFGFDIGDMTYQDIFKEGTDVVEELGSHGNHLFGYPSDLVTYPAYPRNEPRDLNTELRKYDRLLFQFDVHYLDSSYNDYFYDNGGCGIAGFYIQSKDLEKKDFGHILYHWGACEQL